MTYLLDTNICIYVIKNKPEQVFRRFRENFQQGLYISGHYFGRIGARCTKKR